MRTGFRVLVTLILAFATAIALNGQARPAETMLESAKKLEVVDGNYASAIRQYQQIVDKFSKTDRQSAAIALLRMADCYSKLGDAQAKTPLERLLKEFADQGPQAAEARERLAAVASPASRPGESRPSQQQVVAWGGDMAYQNSIPRDGSVVLLVDGGHLYVHDLRTPAPPEPKLSLPQGVTKKIARRIVVGSAGSRVGNAVISADGRQIAYTMFAESRWTLHVVRPDGIGDRVVKDFGGRPVLLCDWSPDARRVLMGQMNPRGPMEWISVSDGAMTPIPGAPQLEAGQAKVSGDGQLIGFLGTDRPASGQPERGLFVMPAEGGVATRIPMDGIVMVGQWSPDGAGLLVIRSNRSDTSARTDLMLQPIARGVPDGAARLVRAGISRFVGAIAGGEYYYQARSYNRTLFSVDIDAETARPTGPAKPAVALQGDNSSSGTWSRDSQSVIYATRVNDAPALVSMPLASRKSTVLPVKGPLFFALGTQFRLSPDGGTMFVTNVLGGTFRVDTTSGESRLIELARLVMSPDGRTAFSWKSDTTTHRTKVFRRDLDQPTATEVCELAADSIFSLAVSPDGSQLAIVVQIGVNPDGYRAIMIAPAQGGQAREILRPARSRDAIWSKSGRHVIFIGQVAGAQSPGGDIWSLDVSTPGATPVGFNVGLDALSALTLDPSGTKILFLDEDHQNELWRGWWPVVR